MAEKWKRPTYIELCPEEVEWHMQRGRQLRSEAAHEMLRAIASYFRRTFAAAASARHVSGDERAGDRRVHV